MPKTKKQVKLSLIKEEQALLRRGQRLQAISMFIRRTSAGLIQATQICEKWAQENGIPPASMLPNVGVDINQNAEGHITISVDSEHYRVLIHDQSKVIDGEERLFKIINISRMA